MRWVIGDIHGMMRSLEGLLDAVRGRDAAARFLFTGDYVNRGPDANGVIELLLSMGGEASFVRGNHDDVFDLILNGQSYCGYPNGNDRLAAFDWFMNFGLANTYNSYGVDYAELNYLWRHLSPRGLDRLNELVPESHRQFVRSLVPVVQHDDLFVAHAQWNPDETDDAARMGAILSRSDPQRHALLWGRYGAGEIGRNKRWSRTGYFGHTPVMSFPDALTGGENVPIRAPKIWLLDTGAALIAGGRLSAACHETGEVLQVDRAGGLVAEAAA